MSNGIRYAVLIDKKVVSSTLEEWGHFLNEKIEGRRVAEDYVGKVHISTVFLGLNHSFDDGPPLWFETMIFEGEHDQYQERYETYEQAEAGHKQAVELVKNSKQEESHEKIQK